MRSVYLFKLKFNTPYGLRVGGNREDINALTPISINGNYLIPASSWKGVFRRVSEILFASKEHFNGHKGEKVKIDESLNFEAKGVESEEEKMRFTAMWNCPIERLYGSEYFAGAVTFSDTVISSGIYERVHVSIDRKSKRSLEGHLFREQIIDVKSVYVKVIVRDMIEEWVKTLKFMSEVGTFIGGGKSRGIGYVLLDWKESEFAEVRYPKVIFKPLSELG